ncbi:hypothetical protein [Sulfitobacter sp. MF3-043]|uniref:hypothetical protein n=1 Tax=Sulfitobacter sediminivivens TaxID=3252902 RepID=UPI0036DF886E
MIRMIVASVALVSLAACGGGSRYSSGNANRGYYAQPVLFATGPIHRACVSANRKAATPARCGCVQAVADQSLDAGDQRRGVQLFKDPHKAQEIRQSKNASNERFWLAWKEFGQNAAAACGNV